MPNSTRVPGLSAGGAVGQGVAAHVDVGAVLLGQEPEALLGVEPLHLASGHGHFLFLLRGAADAGAQKPRGPTMRDAMGRARTQAVAAEPAARRSSSQSGKSVRSASTTSVPASTSSFSEQPPVSTETLVIPAASAPSTSWTWSPTRIEAPSRSSASALAAPDDQPGHAVDVEGEVVDVAAGVGLVLPGDHHHPAAMASYGGDGLDGAGERLDRVDGMVDVELAEPVDERVHRVGRHVAARAARRAAGRGVEVSSSTGRSTPSSAPRAVSVLTTPGTVSISVMSRSKATTSMPRS